MANHNMQYAIRIRFTHFASIMRYMRRLTALGPNNRLTVEAWGNAQWLGECCDMLPVVLGERAA